MRKVICAAAIGALSATNNMTAQNAAMIQKVDAPPNGVWVDSLDLSEVPIRRGRGQRGQTTPPPPLVFKLGGVTYPHALAPVSDGRLTIHPRRPPTPLVSVVRIHHRDPP